MPFDKRNGDQKTTLRWAFAGSKWHYTEFKESMECNFEGLEGIMPKVSTANAHLLLFALVCIKNLFIGKSSFMDKT